MRGGGGEFGGAAWGAGRAEVPIVAPEGGQWEATAGEGWGAGDPGGLRGQRGVAIGGRCFSEGFSGQEKPAKKNPASL